MFDTTAATIEHIIGSFKWRTPNLANCWWHVSPLHSGHLLDVIAGQAFDD